MFQKKIICDRCEKVIFDSANKQETNIVDALFGTGTEELGYVEINVVRLDGECTKKMHFCGDCYDIAVKAWNKKE